MGSTLEGLLLGISRKYPQKYNQATTAPKDNKTNKIVPFHKWTLNNYIDVAHEVGDIKEDVKKFSHVLRDFRNYIHPFQQAKEEFNPSIQTALICIQVLKAAIYQINESLGNNNDKAQNEKENFEI